MTERLNELGEAELEVLKTLWDAGPTTVRQVMQTLHESGRKVAYTTVLTFLTRLEQKGFVTSNKSGLAYVYRAKVSRERVSRSRLKNLLQELYDGAAGPLVLQLMKSERLTPEEIDELQKLIDQLGDSTPGSKKSDGPKRG
jgi:BlaI family penicillinase repressor